MHNRLVAFGGVDSGLPTNVTAQWNGTSWAVAPPTAGPSARTFASMAFDEARGGCVMFGGTSLPTTALAETWTWDGAAWTQRFPAAAPSARHSASMAYDSARQVVVLFGGFQAGSLSAANDTWEWDGSTWTLRTALIVTPPPRHNAAMAYDAARGVVVMCGGYDPVAQSSLSDTWAFDGVVWTQWASLPMPVSAHSLVWDAGRQRTVLFGGHTYWQGVFVADLPVVFDHDGTSWIQRVTGSQPGPRNLCAHGYDTLNQRVIAAGGTGTAVLTDTIALAPTTPGTIATFGNGCGGSTSPMWLVATSPPYLGTAFEHRILAAPPTAMFAAIVFGASNTVRNGQPLPLSFAPWGSPACDLNVSDDGFLGVPITNGSGAHTWLVPVQPALVGQQLFAQGFALDPATPTPLGLVATVGSAATIGSP